MQRTLFLALACAAVCALAAKQPPVWPSQFSTGIDRIQQHPRKVQTGRWYYDQKQQADRFDTHHGETIEIEVNRYDLKTRYSIRYQAHQDPKCVASTISGVMPVYSFAGWTNGGTKLIRGVTCDMWSLTTAAATFTYYDRTDTNDPVQYLRHSNTDQEADQDDFYEFDRAPQDPSMFNITYLFPDGCKTAEKPKHSNNAVQKIFDSPVFDTALNQSDSLGCSPISCGAMQSLVRRYFPSEYQTDMICIAFYESSWCPNVYNGICCYGLFQINVNHLGEPGCPSNVNALNTADANAQCALHVLKTQGLNAWQTWSSGDCTHWNRCNA